MAASPAPEPTDLETLRTDLTEQAAYLLDELTALRPLVDRIPEPLQVARPLDAEPSIREYYGLIAERDAGERLAWLREVAQIEPRPEPSSAATMWNDLSMPEILDRVQEARAALVTTLRALPAEAWQRTGMVNGQPRSVYGFVHAFIQEDTDVLRTLGYRMHESHMTARSEDLPK